MILFSRFASPPCPYTVLEVKLHHLGLIIVASLAALFYNIAPASAVTASAAFPAARASGPPGLKPGVGEWPAGAVEGSFKNVTTHGAAPLATSVWLLYDAANVYVGFRAQQQGLPITATQSENDVGFGIDDFVGIGIDTSGSGNTVYYFEVTPRGVRYEQASENARYRAQWQAWTSVEGSTWYAVLKIPLRAMRLHGGSPQTWRVNFIRAIAANAEHYTWAYDGLMQDFTAGAWPVFTDSRYWPRWTGIVLDSKMLRAVRPKPRAEVYALQSAGADRQQFAQANGTFAQQHVRPAGIDFSYPLTSTINFAGTLNPDFSNVEIDQQTIAPQEFRRVLQEYRPFFSQGAAFFNPNPIVVNANSVFYSPSVGPFDRGTKIEGSFGLQSFGVMNFRGFDETSDNEFDDTVFGYKHALADRTFIYWANGVLAHHSVYGDDSTGEFGVSGRNLHTGFVWGFDDAQENAAQSWLPGGHASSALGFLDVHKPNYEFFAGLSRITPFFNPIDGITQTSDVEGPSLSFDTTAATKHVKNFFANVFVDRYTDRSGAVHQADFDTQILATFNNGFSIDGLGTQTGELRSYAQPGTSPACGDPSLPRSYFTGAPSYLCGRTDPFNLVVVPIGYGDGTPFPIDASASFGKFGYDNWLHLYTIAFSRPLRHGFALGAEWDGTFERAISSGARNGQFLRRLTLSGNMGANANFSISLRAINGTGGFALPGNNIAVAFHRTFRSGNELFLNYGTPAASTTLDRFIVKYLLRFGGDAGT